MNPLLRFIYASIFFLFVVFLNDPAGIRPLSNGTVPTNTSWYFAVSGDSRDCGDLIMPRIAQAIVDQTSTAPISFYWHLGDFRALYRVDCDIGKRTNPDFRCVKRDPSPDETTEQKSAYLKTAWDDFINQQLAPFRKNKIPVFLGIGNHELIPTPKRDPYREKFAPWLKQDAIETERKLDQTNNIKSSSGDTFYHFVRNGVDFIYLDNADHNAFFHKEIDWLFRVLAADAEDDADHVLKFYDDFLLRQNLDLVRELFALEMNLRKALSVVYLAAGKEFYNLLCDDQVDVIKQGGEKPTSEHMQKLCENEFFHLTFSQYRGLNQKRPITHVATIVNAILSANSLEDLKVKLAQPPVTRGRQ
jgi:hypothetical protein